MLKKNLGWGIGGSLSILLVIAIIAWYKPAAPVEKPAVIRVGYTAVPQPVLIAEELGYFKNLGLNVELKKFNNASQALDALLRQELDGIGPVSYSSLLALESKSPDQFRVVEGMSESKGNGFSVLIVKKDSGITKPEDLKRKKILMRTGLSSKSQGELVVKALGLDIKEVEFVQVDASLLLQTFATPPITAYLDIQPFGTMIIEQGLGEVLIQSPRAQYIMNPYPLAAGILNKNFVTDYPELSKKYQIAINDAVDFIQRDETAARKIFQKYLSLNDYVTENLPLANYEKLPNINRESINKLSDIELSYKILDKSPDINHWWLVQ